MTINQCAGPVLSDEFKGIVVYNTEKLSADYASGIIDAVVRDSPVYKEIEAKLNNSGHVRLYFQTIIKLKIYPLVYDICENGLRGKAGGGHKKDLFKCGGIDKSILPDLIKAVHEPIDPKYRSEWFYKITQEVEARAGITLKKYIKKIYNRFFTGIGNNRISASKSAEGMIAVKYGEGFKTDGRSDIFWLTEGKIDPRRVIFILQGFSGVRNSHQSEIIATIKKLGFQLVCLKEFIIGRDVPVWYPKKDGRSLSLSLRCRPSSKLDKWICLIGEKLISEVSYWKEFIDELNIRVMFVKDERNPETIIQNIAFCLNGNPSGFLCGHQRSEMYYPSGALIGSHPKNILFTWNARSADYFKPNFDHFLMNVITGYPYDAIYKDNLSVDDRYSRHTGKGDDKFVITLFDNISGGMTNPIKKIMLKNFYECFLRWLKEDKDVFFIIKSKKELALRDLKEICSEISAMEDLGRCCFVLEKETLPAHFSKRSDFAVGIGISTAVTEAVLSGCRGIHCDLTRLYCHDFYDWGYEKIIFDDVGRLICALKEYKRHPENNSDLGEWACHMDALDPFRDGNSGRRIGEYVNWLVEGFDMDMTGRDVLAYANKLYVRQWGENKVIAMENGILNNSNTEEIWTNSKS